MKKVANSRKINILLNAKLIERKIFPNFTKVPVNLTRRFI